MLKCLIGAINPLSSQAERAISSLQVKHKGVKPQDIPLSQRLSTISKVMDGSRPEVGFTNLPALAFFTDVAGPDVLAALIGNDQVDLTIAPKSRFLNHLIEETAAQGWRQE